MPGSAQLTSGRVCAPVPEVWGAGRWARLRPWSGARTLCFTFRWSFLIYVFLNVQGPTTAGCLQTGRVGWLGLWVPRRGWELGRAALLPPGGRHLPCSLASGGRRRFLGRGDVCVGLSLPGASLSAAALRDQRVWHGWRGAQGQRPGEHRAGRRCGQLPRWPAQAWGRCAGWLLLWALCRGRILGLTLHVPYSCPHPRPPGRADPLWAGRAPAAPGAGGGDTRKPNPALFLAWKKT